VADAENVPQLHQLVRAMNTFEVFLDFFFNRSFLIVLLLTALLPKRLPCLPIAGDDPISSSSLFLQTDYTSGSTEK
jgi:hypothetical protein